MKAKVYTIFTGKLTTSSVPICVPNLVKIFIDCLVNLENFASNLLGNLEIFQGEFVNFLRVSRAFRNFVLCFVLKIS